MGHISPAIAKKLVSQGFVTGVKLVSAPNTEFFCELCIYAKAMRKPVLKTHEDKCAKKFGKEVHSDLWGPAPVETKGGRCYYITFVDNYTRFTSAWKSSPKTGKRPRLDWTKTAEDQKFPGPSKTATVVQSSVSNDSGNFKADKRPV